MQMLSSFHDPDEVYRDHHGAPVVGLVFCLVDCYLRARQTRHLARVLGPSWQRKACLASGSRGRPS
jgi:hypothetical protein